MGARGRFAAVAAAAALAWWWRRRERERIRGLARQLARRGWVRVRCGRPKVEAWAAFEAVAVKAWTKVLPTFLLGDVATWPVVPTGRAHAYTLVGATTDASQIAFQIRLWHDHYEAQAVVTALVSDLRFEGCASVWGWRATPWRLWALLTFDPRAVACLPRAVAHRLGGNSGIDGALIDGELNGWGITLFPTPDTLPGEATPRHAHLDGGRCSTFERHGLTSLDAFLADQVAIAFYCCTPGDLDVARGATAVYDGSHLIVAAALRAALRDEPLEWDTIHTAIKEADCGALGGLRVQPALRDGEMLVVSGATVHGAMFAQEAMTGPRPRVLMNPKCYASDAGVFAAALVSSPLTRVRDDPRALWVEAGRSGEDFDRRVEAFGRALAAHPPGVRDAPRT